MRSSPSLGVYQLRMKLASGAGRDEAFPEDKDHHVVPTDWSRDGHLVVSLFSRAINNTVIAISDSGHPGQMTPFLEPAAGNHRAAGPVIARWEMDRL